MSQQHQSISITSTSQPEVTKTNSTQHTSNNDNNIQTVQDVEQAIKKQEKEIKRPTLTQHMDSGVETIIMKKLPLTTTDKPWYNIELINIHQKEHILDSRDYSMPKKSSILAVVALSATTYVLFILFYFLVVIFNAYFYGSNIIY